MPLKGYKPTAEHIRNLSISHLGIAPSNKGNNTQKCRTCGRSFHIKKCHIGKKIFCSRFCYAKEQKKRIPWNKNKTGVYTEAHLKKMSDDRKGKHSSPRTEFRKGCRPHNYSGGITFKDGKYKMILTKDHPTKPAFKYIKNSRLVVEKHLNCVLPRNYIVHHINEDPTDDRIENLMVFKSHSAHARYHSSPKKVNLSEIFFKI